MENLLHKERNLLIIEGIALLILGILAVLLPQVTTLSIGFAFGGILLASGGITLYRSYKVRKDKSFWVSLTSGIFSIIIGVLLLMNVEAGIMALTFLLIAYLCFEGIFKVLFSYAVKPLKNWWIMLLNGGISLLLAYMIILTLPYTFTWVLGFIFGVYLLTTGFSLVAFAMQLEKIEKEVNL